MSRYIDIKFILNETDEFEYENGVLHSISGNSAPTIATKQIKYYDEDEQVWKIGEVIVSDSEKPNNCKDEPQKEICNRPQRDCENCWKELHCRAKDEPQTCENCYYYSDVGVKSCDLEHEPTTPTTKACGKYEPKENCDNCKYKDVEGWEEPCLMCGGFNLYEPQTERSSE